MVEYVGGVSLGIDELFMDHTITTKTSHPGRMAPNTAACFTLLGLSAVVRPRRWTPMHRSVLTVVLGSLTFGLAVVALSGYMASLETAYGWGNLTRMAVHTSVGFTVASLGLLCWIWSRDEGKRSWLPEWMPIPMAVGVLTATLCLWQAVSAEGARIHQQHEDVTSLGSLATLMLVVGALLAVRWPWWRSWHSRPRSDPPSYGRIGTRWRTQSLSAPMSWSRPGNGPSAPTGPRATSWRT